MNKFLKTTFAVLIAAASIISCKNDNDVDEVIELTKPQISNIEIGLNNNEIGTIGKDFHFNAEVVAGDRIDYVKAEILPKTGETYSHPWQYQITWEQNRGAKNSTEHHHFDVPADAAEGTYDFIITVKDLNGTQIQEKRKISLYKAENLPVDPVIYAMNLFKNDDVFYSTVDGYELPPGTVYSKGDTLKGPFTIEGVKADGDAYLVLINKKYNHKPETVAAIDWSKTIVYDKVSHTQAQMPNVGGIGNYPARKIVVGEETADAIGNPITGARGWETGTYYYGIVYTNSTYNMSTFDFIEIPIQINNNVQSDTKNI